MSTQNTVDVSCLCLTHGRPWLLAEAVESFRKQRLGDLSAELLIVNDCPEQTLLCRVPGVRIINTGEWIPDLSTKTNYAMSEARGRFACLWDDDDISLPYRIADGVRLMGDTYCYRPRLCWTWGCGEIRHMGQPLLCAAMFRRDAALELGGCDPGEWNDKSLWDKLWPTGNVVQHDPAPNEAQYIYRWAGIGWHESGAGEQNARVRADQFRAAALVDPRFRRGNVAVEPAWRQPYCELVRQAIANGKGRLRR